MPTEIPSESELESRFRLDCRDRSGIYHFFSRLILNEVDLGLLTLMRQPAFLEALGNLNIDVPEPNEHQLDLLAIDYCRIFIGPKDQAPPFQSVWVDGQMQSECSSSMAEYLGIVGRVEPDTILDDHFGLQLSVMSRVLNAVSMMEQESEFIRLGRAFFIEHIAWAPKMLRAAAGRSETAFYQSLLQAAIGFIEQESSLLSLSNSDAGDAQSESLADEA